MTSFVLPGKRVSSNLSEDVPKELRGVLEITEIVETTISASRGDSATSQTQVDDFDDTDIVEISLEGGLKLWQSVADTRADFARADRSVSDQALLVPRQLPLQNRSGSRAASGYLVEATKVLKTGFAGKAGELGAVALARHIESSITPGFFRCSHNEDTVPPTLSLDPPQIKKIDIKKPMLVLVHGTFSSTNGSFGDLAGPAGDSQEGPAGQSDLWDALEAAFPAGIFALEHWSVTVDPIQNALDLVSALPDGARVTLLSHSRGGLVAELVARAARVNAQDGAFDEFDRATLSKAGRSTELLVALSAKIAEKKIKVERLIRVAGPLRGTSLASNRLDRFLSLALNTFELVPALKASTAYGLLKSFLIGFVKTKADPKQLPGLEAMMPSSPLIGMLNRPDVRFGGSLHVIAGDNDGKGVFQKLRNLAVDLFFEGDNDFVVNTASMSKGSARLSEQIRTDIISSDITHFAYFRTEAARAAILNAAHSIPVTIPDAAGEDLVFDPSPEAFNVPRSRDAGSLPVCFFLPGVMGTHLNHIDSNGRDRWIWTNPARIATGGLSRLKFGAAGTVVPGDPMDRYYGDLARFLARSHDVIPFPYDWRASVLATGANALAEAVRKALAETDKPIRFLAHSMGGLVVRAFIDAHPSVWAEVKRRKGSRFVMLGTPNGGAFSMLHTMMGRAKAIKQLATADLVHSKSQLLDIVTSMPGPAQLLPSNDAGHYLKRATWTGLRNLDDGEWVVPPEAALSASRDAHALFKSQKLDPKLTCYVAGHGTEPTPSDIRLDPVADGSKKVTFLGTYRGDGTVTWDTGIPEGIAPYYIDAIHGDLARTKSAFPGIFDLLDRGETSALSRTAPAHARDGSGDAVEIPEVELEIYPEPEELVDSLLGADHTSRTGPVRPVHQIDVTMVHGDLRFARHPVLVGHYQGDPINGAEAVLDQCLSNHLNEVRNLGLYPGAIETCEVVLRLDRNPGGAVIAGLGRFGNLTPGQLRKTVNRAVLRYVLSLQRRTIDKGKDLSDMDPVALTCLVIGHKGANMTVQQSVQAILEAVADANRALADTTPISSLEFMEIFEDTAFKAASALNSASMNGQMAGLFKFDDRIKTGHGARLRMDFGIEPDSWQRISVKRNKSELDVLDFTVVTEGAKAEFKKTAVQTEVIERLLKESRKGTGTQRTLGKLLFELMIPFELKSFAQNDQKIQLILDESTANIPWELMEDDIGTFGEGLYQSSGESDFKPLVIRTPIIRQLVTDGSTVRRATDNAALVVGDPKSSLPPLPGAEKEARLVAQRLKRDGKFEVDPLIPPESGISVLERAMLKPYKIMHFAAHGIYDDKGPIHRAGLVLSDGISLTSAELSNLRYIPELVFLNCCHIGRVEVETGVIAASLSRTLIGKGVRAVIAAGWAVDDDAAHLFAREFYDSMLNGNTFGNAVHHARTTVFAQFPEKNTWGAYQCYGDPDYRLDERDGDGDTSSGQKPRYFSAEHARKAAINIERDLGTALRSRERLAGELDALRDSSDPEWHSDARWCEAMGRAYAKLDVFPSAIEFLEKAKRLSRSHATLNAIELLESLKVRAATYAWSQAEAKVARTKDPEALKIAKQRAKELRDAQRATAKGALACLNDLDHLVGGSGDPAPTERREVLKGTVSKRLVLTSRRGRSRQAALLRMVDHYGAAMTLAAQQRPGLLKTHPTYNWLSGHVVLGSLAAQGQPLEFWFDRLLAQSHAAEDETPAFWTAVLPAEIDILRGLMAKPDDRDTIFRRFEGTFHYAWNRGATFQQARSIREHVHFLKLMFDGGNPSDTLWMTRIQVFLNDLTWSYRDNQPDSF